MPLEQDPRKLFKKSEEEYILEIKSQQEKYERLEKQHEQLQREHSKVKEQLYVARLELEDEIEKNAALNAANDPQLAKKESIKVKVKKDPVTEILEKI